MCKGKRHCDRAVARHAPREPRCLCEVRTNEERFDAFVNVAEARFETHDRFSARRKSEMTRLDDACVHGPHRNLVQTLTVGRQKWITDWLCRGRLWRQ